MDNGHGVTLFSWLAKFLFRCVCLATASFHSPSLWSLSWYYFLKKKLVHFSIKQSCVLGQVLCRIILIHSPTTFLVVLRCLVTLAGKYFFLFPSLAWFGLALIGFFEYCLKCSGFCWSTFASMQFLGDCTAPARWWFTSTCWHFNSFTLALKGVPWQSILCSFST